MGPMSRASQTPVMRQYLAAKAAHPDALLFFRMGDFYELFFEDAVVAARALELTLTARNKGSDDEIPMAGVPHHAASAYVQRLLEQGFKVAICEQMADPSKVKGSYRGRSCASSPRAIAFDDAGIDARQNHYLVAIERDGPGLTGSRRSICRRASCRPARRLTKRRPCRLSSGSIPREVLVGQGAEGVTAPLAQARPRAVMRTEGAPLGSDEADAVLDAQLGPGEARASCSSAVARHAAARCVATARACEAGRPLPVARLAFLDLGDTLVLDDATQAHLELVRAMDGGARGSLLDAIDATKTAPGARLLRARLLAPRNSVAHVRRLHDAVDLFVSNPGTRPICARS